jgi:hypothetical protein
MTTIQAQPRDTPAEHHGTPVEIEVDDDLATHVATIEAWCTPRQNWEFSVREGHEFGRPNNVEGRVLFVAAEQTSSLVFRLDQLDAVTDTGQELLLRFEEQDGIAKVARLRANGLEVELFHILTFT